MIFRCYIVEYFVKDKLLSNLFKDECDTPFVKYSDLCVYSTKCLCREIGVLQKSCKSANQEQLKNCHDIGKTRMKIQEASGDFTSEGILFPSSKASYLKTKT